MTWHILILHDGTPAALGFRDELAAQYDVEDRHWSAEVRDDDVYDAVIADFGFSDPRVVPTLRRTLPTIRTERRLFAVDRGMRAARVQATAMGATGFLLRPLDGKALLEILDGTADREALCERLGRRELPQNALGRASILSAEDALADLFAACTTETVLDGTRVQSASREVSDAIRDIGMEPWLHQVRQHHRGTFQHCLLVTGVAAGFGAALGMSRNDTELLAQAALVHDVGKAFVPTEILDKPGRLDDDELIVMRTHPEAGGNFLRSLHGAINADVLDAAIHHHEMLDGSGYPHGLRPAEIGDLTRIMTICDIYGALTEKRAYKPPMPKQKCIQILNDMVGQGKLDPALVRAMEAVAKNDASSLLSPKSSSAARSAERLRA